MTYEKPLQLSDAEWEVVLDLRKRNVYNAGFNAGLLAAAEETRNWAAKFSAGDEIEETLIVLAEAICRLAK